MWLWILSACVLAFMTKMVGFLLPEKLMQKPIVTAMSSSMTVGLLAALIVANTLGSGTEIVIDARLAAFAVAIVLLAFDCPFLCVVIAGAAASAVVRLLTDGQGEPYLSLALLCVAAVVMIYRIWAAHAMTGTNNKD